MPVSSEAVKDMLSNKQKSALLKCDQCDAEFPNNQMLGAHKTSHRTRNCKYCGKVANLVAIGSHEKWCMDNPNRGKKVGGEVVTKPEAKKARVAAKADAKTGATRKSSKKDNALDKVISEKSTVVPIKSDSIQNVNEVEADVESLLSLMFPNGIPADKFLKAVEWVHITEALLR